MRNYGVSGADYLQMLSSTVFAAPAYQGYGALIAAESIPRRIPAGAGAEGRRAGAGRRADSHTPMPFAGVLKDNFLDAMAQGMRIWTGPRWPRWRRGGRASNERGLGPVFPFSEHDVRRRRRKQSFLHIDNQQRGGHGGSRREDKWRQHTGWRGRKIWSTPCSRSRFTRSCPPFGVACASCRSAVNTGLAQNRFTGSPYCCGRAGERYAGRRTTIKYNPRSPAAPRPTPAYALRRSSQPRPRRVREPASALAICTALSSVMY